MEDLGRRLASAGADLQALRPELIAGEPWPLSSTYEHVPEADWGPREVLSHIDEMLEYWITELRRVVAGDGREPVAFGRVATDATRLARIEAGRQKSTGELVDDVGSGLDGASTFVRGLSPAELGRVGSHPTRGDLTVAESIDRFLCSHLEEHIAQLRTILRRAAGG